MQRADGNQLTASAESRSIGCCSGLAGGDAASPNSLVSRSNEELRLNDSSSISGSCLKLALLATKSGLVMIFQTEPLTFPLPSTVCLFILLFCRRDSGGYTKP